MAGRVIVHVIAKVLSMRRTKNQCPNCNAEVAPNYRFCLLCGSELPESDDESVDFDPEPEMNVASAAPEKKGWGRKQKADPVPAEHAETSPEPAKSSKRGWGRKKQAAPEPPAPAYSAYGYTAPPEPASSGKKGWGRKKKKTEQSSPMISSNYTFMPPTQQIKKKKKDSSGFLQFILFVLLLGGAAFGGMWLWNDNQTDAANKITWEEVQALDYQGIWDKLNQNSEMAIPVGVPADAVAARFVSLGDDGTISVKVDDAVMHVRLAGVPMGFVDQCLGDQAVARLNRILVVDEVVFVSLDGQGTLGSAGDETQPVYLWRKDPASGKVRYANEELLASGEVDYTEVFMDHSDPGVDLGRAWLRAQQKQRGRYAPGACY